jgi:hypothetical protein
MRTATFGLVGTAIPFKSDSIVGASIKAPKCAGDFKPCATISQQGTKQQEGDELNEKTSVNWIGGNRITSDARRSV